MEFTTNLYQAINCWLCPSRQWNMEAPMLNIHLQNLLNPTYSTYNWTRKIYIISNISWTLTWMMKLWHKFLFLAFIDILVNLHKSHRMGKTSLSDLFSQQTKFHTLGEHLAALTWHPAPAMAWVGATDTLPPPLFPWLDNAILAAIRSACFMPSSSRMRRIFDGSSSMGICTRLRHSGHLNSCFVLTISSRHRRQNVCWHGSTLLDNSNRSRQTEHSNSSFNTRSSIL